MFAKRWRSGDVTVVVSSCQGLMESKYNHDLTFPLQDTVRVSVCFSLGAGTGEVLYKEISDQLKAPSSSKPLIVVLPVTAIRGIFFQKFWTAGGRAPSMSLGNTSKDLFGFFSMFLDFFVFFCFQTLIGTWIIEKSHLLLLWGSWSPCPWAVSFLLLHSQRPRSGSCSFLFCLTKAALWSWSHQ